MNIFTVFQFFSPHLFNAKVFLVDVKEHDFEDADEGNDMASTGNRNYASSSKFSFSAKTHTTPGLGGTNKADGLKCDSPRDGCIHCKRQKQWNQKKSKKGGAI